MQPEKNCFHPANSGGNFNPNFCSLLQNLDLTFKTYIMIQKSVLKLSILAIFLSVFLPETVSAQQYKIRQSSGMMGMNSEPTVYVKGMRKRTEPGKSMGMQMPVTIEQCDLQRTIKINDKKKLYYIEPFANLQEEIIDEDLPKTKQPPAKPKPTTTKNGGVIEMWYTITDTGERKKMYGFTARHVWTYQKMKPINACYMKDSMIIKTDGWYIDLPQFNCPVRTSSFNKPQQPGELIKPDCKDRIINHRKGKGKLGFPLEETTTIIMGGSGMQSGIDITTTINTLEFSTAKLDSMLFEIPPGYTETKNEDDLMEKVNVMDMIDAMGGMKDIPGMNQVVNEQKKEGIIRIGVFVPTGNEEVQGAVLQKQMLPSLMSDKTEAVAVTDEAEARKMNCDYTLSSEFTKVKAASKVGGLLKAIKNADPSASQSYNIDVALTLRALGDGSVKTQPTVSGKYNGKIDVAAFGALEEGCGKVMKAIK